MPVIAYATSLALKDLTRDDQTTVEPLRERGVEVRPAVWNDHDVDWAAFDAVIIRSPWDYHRHGEEFLEWLTTLDRVGVPVHNPTDVLRWNLDKRYLRWVEERGGSVVPTEWVEQGATVNVAEVLERRGWKNAVLKPTISAGASDTWVTGLARAEDDAAKIAPILKRGGLMIQPYLAEIATEGELSMLFYGGKYSHAVRKRPALGDFRVQTDYGGTVEPANPGPAVLSEAQRIVELRGEQLLYARVDGVVVGEEFQLMELELLEPQLFFPYHPHAAARWAEAVVAVLR